MSEESSKIQSRLYGALTFSLPLIVLALLLYHRPFWGHMDDNANLLIAEQMRTDGIFSTWWNHSMIDLFDHGRLRSIYFATIAIIYLPAGSSSVTAFAINIVFLSAILYFAAVAFWSCARDAYGLTQRRAFIFAFVALSFAYPWTVYAIRAPSVQEKIVLLFAALVLWVQYHFSGKSYGVWASFTVLSLLVSVQTKETIALFFPLFLAAQLHLDFPKRSYVRTASLLTLLLALASLIKWAGTHGTYKAAYGMERAAQTLVNSKSLYVFFLLALAAGSVALLDYFRHKSVTRFFLALSSPVGLLLFLGLMIPWGLGGYLNCSATVFVVMCVIGLFKYARSRLVFLRKQSLLVYAAFAYVAACLVFFTRLNADYSTYADLRRVLFSPELSSAAEKGKTLWMPCAEGAYTIEHYMLRFRGIKLATRMPNDNPVLAMNADQYWLTSPGNCSGEQNVSDWIARGEAETLIAPHYKGGYTLVRRIKAP